MNTVLTYTVLTGDTLSSIANNISASAGITTAQIEMANPDIPPYALQVGQQIHIPFLNESNRTWRYTILSGNSFDNIASSLAQCHGLTYQEIATNNQLTSDVIQIGQLLAIPSTKKASTKEAATTPSSSASKLSPQAKNMGYWDWTWSGTACPQNATLSMAFSGWAEVKTALQNSAKCQPCLVGTTYLSIGGGNNNGRFNVTVLNDINNAIQAGKLAGYDGIAYDVEGGDSGLSQAFTNSFKTAKENGFKVLVTVSHSAPYGITDADTLMKAFFADDNIDILSPQLYSTGEEGSNEYATTSGTTTTWADYATSKAAVVPSIIHSSWYNDPESPNNSTDAKAYFEEQGVELQGYIQWQQIS